MQDKEHWWWDTNTSSDGGCVNDATMRTFFSQQLQPSLTRLEETDRSKKKKNGKRSDLTEDLRESGSVPSHRYAVVRSPSEFEVVVVNPANFGSKGGLRVLQQKRPHRQSRIRVSLEGGVCMVITRNVRRLAFVQVRDFLVCS